MGHDLRLLLERLEAEPAGDVEAPTMRRLCEDLGARCLFSADGEYLAIDGEVLRLPFDPDMDQTESVNDFVNDASEDDAEQFGVRIPDVSEDFWESPAPLYHATPEENVESIREEGLGERSRTRGLSNRGVGAAVYTSTAIEDLEEGSYGDAIFVIDTEAMKRAGYTPRVDVEPDVAEAAWREALAWRLGDEEYSWEIEQGMSPNTIVVFGHIPPKYLALVEPGRRQNPVSPAIPPRMMLALRVAYENGKITDQVAVSGVHPSTLRAAAERGLLRYVGRELRVGAVDAYDKAGVYALTDAGRSALGVA